MLAEPSDPSLVLPPPRPFVKWAGGKSRLVSQLTPLLPPDIHERRLVEPFVGGGAMFFARRPARAILSDINPDLIHTYRSIRDDVAGVIAALAPLAAAGHDPATYYAVRARYNAGDGHGAPLRAALFIYLNKTCFNGLHRVNRRGEFNVPVGRYRNPAILDLPTLTAASLALARVDIACAPFEAALGGVGPRDFVYLDPPYAPVSATSSFTAYASGGFSEADQHRLRDVVVELRQRGAKVMLTNSDVPLVRELYRGFHITPIHAPRAVNARASGRGLVRELAIRDYGWH